jgi:hypothetical protein
METGFKLGGTSMDKNIKSKKKKRRRGILATS